MVKLIMTDIDGTLLPDGTMDINPEYFEVIEKLVEKGIIFVVASGRHMSSVKKVFAPVLDKISFCDDRLSVHMVKFFCLGEC